MILFMITENGGKNMGYDRMEQEKSPTEMMYGLTRAFYEEKDAEKIVGFYDPKAICWFGMTERGEAYHIQSLREKLQTIFESMQKTCMEKENYRVVTENNKSCMISGNLALLENGERIENEISAFWTFFQGVWYLSRFSIQHAGMTPEPEKQVLEEKLDLEKSRNQTLMNLIQGSVLEYDVLKDQLDLYIQRSMREPKKHMVYPDLVKSGKALFQAAVHPDDREKLERAFLHHFNLFLGFEIIISNVQLQKNALILLGLMIVTVQFFKLCDLIINICSNLLQVFLTLVPAQGKNLACNQDLRFIFG